MFGMGLTIRDGRLQGCIFKTKRSTDRICVAVYDHAADRLDPLYDFKTSDGTGTWCDPGRLLSGGTASNVITYIAGAMWLCWYDDRFHFGPAPLMTPLLVYILAGTWVEVSFWAMVISVVKVILIPVLLGILIRTLFGKQIEKFQKCCR